MAVPVVTFFSSRGGVEKPSLVYHTAWMLSELGRRVLVVDLDPQANLTASFLPDRELDRLFDESDASLRSIAHAVRPVVRGGATNEPSVVPASPNLGLVPGDPALARLEEGLSKHWPKCFDAANAGEAFQGTTVFWRVAQEAAETMRADVVLFEVGPSLGATNRAALVATDHVVVPVAGDVFFSQELRNIGHTLRDWREEWQVRLETYAGPALQLPRGAMQPTGYVVSPYGSLRDGALSESGARRDRIPHDYFDVGLATSRFEGGPVEDDPDCLAVLKPYRSLMSMAHEARKPVFLLRAADGALGSHGKAVQLAYQDFQLFTKKLLERIGLA